MLFDIIDGKLDYIMYGGEVTSDVFTTQYTQTTTMWYPIF